MGNWIGVITNAGTDVLGSWAAGGSLSIERAAGGTGVVSEVALTAQTGLVQEKQAVSIIASDKVPHGVRLKLRLAEASAAFTLQQLGIWASVSNGPRTLIALYQHKEGIPIPSKADAPDFRYTFYAILSCSNEGEWSLTVDTSTAVTPDDIAEAIDRGVTFKDVTIAGRTTLQGTLDAKDIRVGGFDSNGNPSGNKSSLRVNGTLQTFGELKVGGTIRADDDIECEKVHCTGVESSGDLKAKKIEATGDLRVRGQAEFDSTVKMHKDVALDASLTVNGTTRTKGDLITSKTVKPEKDITADLGGSSKRYKKGYIQTVIADEVRVGPKGIPLKNCGRTATVVIGTKKAGYTESDCDYLCSGTADEVVINEAIYECKPGETVILLPGTYNLAGAVSISTSVYLSGYGATFYRAFNGGYLISVEVSGVTICGVTLDGNRREGEGISILGHDTTLKDCSFKNIYYEYEYEDDEGLQDGVFGLVVKLEESKLLIDSCSVQGCYQFIRTDYYDDERPSDITVRNSTIWGYSSLSASDFLQFMNCDYVTVEGCKFSGVCGCYFYNCTHVRVVDNDARLQANVYLPDLADLRDCRVALISGNSIHVSNTTVYGSCGVNLSGDTDVIVTHNTFVDAELSVTRGYPREGKGLIVSQNTFVVEDFSGVPQLVEISAVSVVFTDNLFVDLLTPSFFYKILRFWKTTKLIITGNMIESTRARVAFADSCTQVTEANNLYTVDQY